MVPPDGVYSAQVLGQTYTSAGGFLVNFPPGTYVIEGSFRGTAFGIGFGNLLQGGVQSGSVRSLAGPAPTTNACGVTYLGSGSQQAFRVQFTVTSNNNSACQ